MQRTLLHDTDRQHSAQTEPCRFDRRPGRPRRKSAQVKDQRKTVLSRANLILADMLHTRLMDSVTDPVAPQFFSSIQSLYYIKTPVQPRNSKNN